MNIKEVLLAKGFDKDILVWCNKVPIENTEDCQKKLNKLNVTDKTFGVILCKYIPNQRNYFLNFGKYLKQFLIRKKYMIHENIVNETIYSRRELPSSSESDSSDSETDYTVCRKCMARYNNLSNCPVCSNNLPMKSFQTNIVSSDENINKRNVFNQEVYDQTPIYNFLVDLLNNHFSLQEPQRDITLIMNTFVEEINKKPVKGGARRGLLLLLIANITGVPINELIQTIDSDKYTLKEYSKGLKEFSHIKPLEIQQRLDLSWIPDITLQNKIMNVWKNIKDDVPKNIGINTVIYYYTHINQKEIYKHFKTPLINIKGFKQYIKRF
jgi:hypothetical protein